MNCKDKNCTNENLQDRNYCETHLCERTIKGVRCKNKKIKNSPFCWSHHYFVNKTSTFINLITILAFLFGLYMLPPVR